jgi:acyl dehydratase
VDRGEGKGALLTVERILTDRASGERLARIAAVMVLRGNGGFGGPPRSGIAPHVIPDRPPDQSITTATSLRAALIYRLSGDLNPLHVDPKVAAAGGFTRPILHGLCTFGVVGRALIEGACDFDPTRLRMMRARFTSPTYPGEVVRTDIWVDRETISFRATVLERDVVVLNNGCATVSPP